MKSDQCFLRGSSMVYHVHRLGVVDHDESLLLSAVHPTHQDHAVILFTTIGISNKDWLCRKHPLGHLLDDETPLVYIEFDHRSVQVEDVLCHVGVFVRLSQVGGVDIGELEGAVGLHLDEVLDLDELPVGHVDGVSGHGGPVVRVGLTGQHDVKVGPVVVRTGIEILQHVEMQLVGDGVLVGAEHVSDEQVRDGHLGHEAAVG